jgi:methyl-accepting chemotaxis protein
VDDDLNTKAQDPPLDRIFVSEDSPARSLEEDLDLSASDLERHFQLMEREFLALGARLHDYRERSRAISEKAADITSRMGGGDLSFAIESLNRFQKKIKEAGGSSSQSTAALSKILARFSEIGPPLRSLAKIVNFLDVISVIMRIENTRIQATETGFNTVAQGLKDLGNTIRIKSENLEIRSDSMVASIQQSLQAVQKNESLQSDQARLILNRIFSSLEPLQDKRLASAATMNNLSIRYRSISRSIGNVVASLQFHDITRQRIEHSSKALREMGDTLAHLDTRDWEHTLSDAAEISRLQAAQLYHAKEDLKKAVGAIKESLRTLADEINTISREIRNLAGIAEQTEDSFLGDIKRNLSSLRNASSEYVRIHGEISAAMSSVNSTVNEIASFARDIKQIGTGMRIMAMNASVNASRIGMEGLSLGVLAQETQELAAETVGQIHLISEILKSVVDAARNLSMDGPDTSAEQLEESRKLNSEIEEIERRLQETDCYVAGALREIEDLNDVLSTDVAAAIDSFQSPEVFMIEIGKIGERLESFVVRARELLDKEGVRIQSTRLNDLTARYTMKRERKIHQSVLDSDTGAADAALEMDSAEAAGNAGFHPENTSELGENVELF